jgi:TusA-related sulfurtransferase
MRNKDRVFDAGIDVESGMPLTKALDLTDTVSFVSLLKCQKELAQMKPGDSLEVIMNDPDMVEDLTKIVDRSMNRVTERSLNGDRFKIKITKETRFNEKSIE